MAARDLERKDRELLLYGSWFRKIFINFQLLFYVFVCAHAPRRLSEGSREHAGVGSLLPPCGSQGPQLRLSDLVTDMLTD